MKKILAIILMLTTLTGCSALQESAPTQTPTETQATTPPVETSAPTEAESEPAAEQLPMVAISIPMNIETIKAEDGTVIFRKTSQSMQLTMRDPDVADKIIIDFLNRVDAHTEGADSTREAAEASYSADPMWSNYFYDVIYTPNRIDHSVLSLYGESISYSGGNHPLRICSAANYNMVTGDVLTLGSILYHIDSKEALVDLVLNRLSMIADEKYLLDGYEDVVRKRFETDESFDEDWYFTNEGLCFYFAPYEIAPYSSGVIVAQVPYSELSGIIDDAFFPAEEDLCEGNILAKHMDSADMDQFSQIAEVTVDKDGEMFFLYTTGAVRNLRIQAVTAGDEISEFGAEHTIFATYTLTPGDAIMLKVLPIADEASTLKLSYESSGELHHIILSPEFLNG